MDATYLGTWQVDLTKTVGMEAWSKAMGMSEEKLAKYKSLDYAVTLAAEGDAYTVSIDFKGKAPNKSYTVKLGEEIDYHSMDGYTCKLTLTFENGKTVESYVYAEKDLKWNVTRNVEGDVMTAVATLGDVSTTQILNRV